MHEEGIVGCRVDAKEDIVKGRVDERERLYERQG